MPVAVENLACPQERILSFFLSVSDHITGTSFLIASSIQIFLIPATQVDRLKGSCNFTLETINKPLIQTYGQKFSFLNLELHHLFTFL